MINAYEEILDFVTSAPTLEQIIDFEHSPATLERVTYLTEHEALSNVTRKERYELREFRKAAYFVEQLKIRARRRLGQEQPESYPHNEDGW
jgi:hypothetical protein